ncbi:uncharacterized protein LOC118202180 [Stegodyphus dumicola]|uniref:uncharacterized protein LOC118202180 n=1 Tax=Stegodyphus dumicola TaxID=202533 RepID=UPI0015AFD09E|nr:uncharacterized protein LOC118202180 [Stegodyphus dumicola]
MTEVKEKNEPRVVYYMPHHGVYRPQKTATKLRTVFNASCLTSNGISLNSLQRNEGVIQDDLFSMMRRFEKYPFAFTADIRRMYKMIEINPEQRCLQRILCGNESDAPGKSYELIL